MTKYFCDECGDEITSRNKCYGSDTYPGSLFVKSSTAQAAVIIGGKNGNDIVLCKYCVIDLVNRADDRPTQTP